jgi:ATP-binding cassette subfamily B protein
MPMSNDKNRKSQAEAASRRQGAGGPIPIGEKPKNFRKTWGKLLVYIGKYLPVMIIAILCSFIGTVFTIVGPKQLERITDLITEGIVTGIDLQAVGKIAIILTILYGTGAIFSYVQGFIMSTVTQTISKKLRSEISDKINRLPLKYFDHHSLGDVLSRVTNDIDTIGMTMNQSISNLVSAITLFLGSLFMMLITNVLMTLGAVVATVIGILLLMLIMSKSQKYFKRQQDALGDINGHIEEIYSGHDVVKAFNGEKKARERFEEINSRLKTNVWKSQFLSGIMMPLMHFVGNFGYVAVCVIGAVLVIQGSISFGVVVAFMIYVRLFTQPLSQMAQASQNLQSTAAASERVFDFLAEEELSDENGKDQTLKNVKGDVEFQHVKFGYDKDNTIIHDFSAHAKPGQKIAIVGPTGAGKTTLVNLLMRFYELDDGEIKIDGVPISKLTRRTVHEQFCMVLQDTWLFDGSIRENIVYNKEGVTDEQIHNACEIVGMNHYIKSLPNGYDTVLDDRTSLSAGQKQLLTIARAIIEDAPMLILDEATSSVDTRTEELIQRAMDTLMVDRTSFIIAHRLSTIKNADLILVMKDGDIIEKGNHEELLKQSGFYADLYNSQFEKLS